MDIRCIAPIEKFRDYVLKPGYDQGKFAVFHALGYTQEHAEHLVSIFMQQAAERYRVGDFRSGKKYQHGQRITIEIVLNGVGDNSGKTSYLASGWLVVDADTIRLTTPFAGFTRHQEQEG